MNDEIEPIYIGEVDDIDIGSVENFEHEEIDYAIFHLESGFFATQGHCNCEEQAYLSESNVEGEELEFSGGFIDLHTKVYKGVLEGNGYGLEDARQAIEIVHLIRKSEPIGLKGDYHPFARLKTSNHPFRK